MDVFLCNFCEQGVGSIRGIIPRTFSSKSMIDEGNDWKNGAGALVFA